jgi:hypothetical protein
MDIIRMKKLIETWSNYYHKSNKYKQEEFENVL